MPLAHAMIGSGMSRGLEAGFALDRLWHWLRGEMDQTKRPALALLARIFEEAGVPYAIIGGVALQIHQAERLYGSCPGIGCAGPWSSVASTPINDQRVAARGFKERNNLTGDSTGGGHAITRQKQKRGLYISFHVAVKSRPERVRPSPDRPVAESELREVMK